MHRSATWIVTVLLGVLLLALVFTLGYVANGDGGSATAQEQSGDQQEPAATGDSDIDFGTLEQILEILQRDHVNRENLDDQALYEAAVNGLLATLDDTGTFYVDPSSYQVSIGPSGSFDGIGATVSQQGSDIVIVAPIKNSPAEAAGVQSGDVITAVNGESTQGWTVDQAVLKIRGPQGSQVTLSLRHPDGTTEDVTITRDEIKVESVTTTPPGGVLRNPDGSEASDLAYVHISDFSASTPAELEAALQAAEDSGKEGLVLDLRNNPGGLLRETVDSADLFLDGGTILIEQDRDGNEQVYTAREGGTATDMPVVILQNQYSASGAEVLAAALKDNGRATIVGEKSFGKGTVNIARELRDGGALFVTIARWLTPAGVQIDEVGISPDIEVVFTPGVDDPSTDPQLARAIEQLHSLQANQPAPAGTP
jgi:carboxyl-terminal processing protease